MKSRHIFRRVNKNQTRRKHHQKQRGGAREMKPQSIDLYNQIIVDCFLLELENLDKITYNESNKLTYDISDAIAHGDNFSLLNTNPYNPELTKFVFDNLKLLYDLYYTNLVEDYGVIEGISPVFRGLPLYNNPETYNIPNIQQLFENSPETYSPDDSIVTLMHKAFKVYKSNGTFRSIDDIFMSWFLYPFGILITTPNIDTDDVEFKDRVIQLMTVELGRPFLNKANKRSTAELASFMLSQQPKAKVQPGWFDKGKVPDEFLAEIMALPTADTLYEGRGLMSGIYNINGMSQVFLLEIAKRVSSPDFCFNAAIFNDLKDDPSIIIDWGGRCKNMDPMFIISPELSTSILTCLQPMFLLTVSLQNYGKDSSHANLIIVDRRSKEVELFEPHGLNQLCKNMAATIDSVLQKYIDEHLPGFKYIAPMYYCPAHGPQTVMINDIGYCAIISALYGHLRILYPFVLRTLIVDNILRFVKIPTFVERYVTFMHRTVPIETLPHSQRALFDRRITNYPIYKDENNVRKIGNLYKRVPLSYRRKQPMVKYIDDNSEIYELNMDENGEYTQGRLIGHLIGPKREFQFIDEILENAKRQKISGGGKTHRKRR